MSGFQKGVKAFAIFLAIMIILSIFSGITFGFSLISNIIEGTNPKETKNYFQTFTDIETIEIDNSISEIQIIAGETFSVEGYEVSSNFKAEVQKKQLKIEEKKSGFWMNKTGKIIVTVPKNTTLYELKMKSGAGRVLIENISSTSLNLVQGAGQVTVKSSEFQQAKIEGGAGKIKIKDSSLRDLSLESGVGAVEIEAVIQGYSKIDCGVGSTELKIKGKKEDYKIHAQKGLGSIKIENEHLNDDSWVGNGKNTLEIEGGVGSIRVDFEQ